MYIGCLAGCTIADYQAGLCTYVQSIDGVGTTDTFDPAKPPRYTVTKVYPGRTPTIIPPGVTPGGVPSLPNNNSNSNNNINLLKNMTLKWQSSSSGSVFRYASNRSLAILFSNSTVAIPTKKTTVYSSNAQFRNHSILIEQLPVSNRNSNSRDGDNYFTSIASTEQIYQQLLSMGITLTFPISDIKTKGAAIQELQSQEKHQFISTNNNNQLNHLLFYVSNNGVNSLNINNLGMFVSCVLIYMSGICCLATCVYIYNIYNYLSTVLL